MIVRVYATGSKGNLYSIGDGNTSLLLEAGLPTAKIQEMLRYRLSDYSACLITHEHGDHIKGAERLSIYMPIISTKETLSDINLVFYQYIEPLATITIGTLIIKAFPVKHNAKNPVGYYIQSTITNETLLFMTDAGFTPICFPRLDYALIECNYDNETIEERYASGELNEAVYKSVKVNHLSLETLKQLLIANNPKEIKKLYLIHGSSSNLNRQKTNQQIKEICNNLEEICE